MPDIKRAERPAHGDAITWFGHACFRVTDAEGHIVLLDPYAPQVMGQSLNGVKADVAIVTHDHYDHNNLKAVKARHVIHAVEELKDGEVKRVGDAPTGLIFTLVPGFHDEAHGLMRGRNAIVVWEEGGLRFCHLGDLGHSLTSEQIEQIGRPDVLMIPVGGHFTIDGDAAREVVSQLKPHVVIPMHYKVSGMTNEDIAIATEDRFLHTDGEAPWDDVRRLNTPVLVVDADALPGGTEVDVLKPPRLH